jgi:hypothetical protein
MNGDSLLSCNAGRLEYRWWQSLNPATGRLEYATVAVSNLATGTGLARFFFWGGGDGFTVAVSGPATGGLEYYMGKAVYNR